MDDEDWLVHYLTFFTFFAIFTLLFIRNRFTYFDRKRLECASVPKVPFGSVFDVIKLESPFWYILWKFYLKFKKRKCCFGGFYLFMQPAYITSDQGLVEMIAKDVGDEFENCLSKSFNHNKKTFDGNDDAVLKIIVKCLFDSWKGFQNDYHGENVNFTVLLKEHMKIFASELIGNKDEDFQNKLLEVYYKKRKLGNFQKLFALTYPSWNFLNWNAKESCKLYKKILQIVLMSKQFQENELAQLKLEKSAIVDLLYNLISQQKIVSNLILFTLYELCWNEEIQDELRGEILRLKKVESLNFDNFNKLEYLECVVCETLRKYPFEPFVVKKSTKHVKINAYDIEKDRLVFISTFGMHHDASNYINPELFDPDRFAPENKQFLRSYISCSNNFDLIYVKSMLKIGLIELVSNYKFTPCKKTINSMRFEESVFEMQPKDDIWLKVE